MITGKDMRDLCFGACVMLAGFFPSATAQYSNAGSVNYQNMLINYDARSVGMGGAAVAVPGGINGVPANPALLAGIRRPQGFVGYQHILDGIWCAPLGVARPLAKGAFSLMLQGLSSGKVEVTRKGADGNGVHTGLFAYDEYLTPGFSYAAPFYESRLLAGFTLKGLYHRISNPPDVYSSKAVAVDIGIQYRWFSNRLILGAVVRNAGIELQPFRSTGYFPVPLIFEAGISYIPRYFPSLRIAADINKGIADYFTVEPGMEIEIYKNVLFGRAGFTVSSRDIEEQFRKFTGDNDEDYIKNNWTVFCFGIGVRTGFREITVLIDFGMQLRTKGFGPSEVLSAVVEF